MNLIVYPGSFDPVTNGHLDIINRAQNLADRLIVAVGVNVGKDTIFSVEERLTFLREATQSLDNVEVATFSGMTVDYCQSVGAQAIVRGLRGLADLEDEISMALTNRTFDKQIETLFLAAAPNHGFVSSRLIRETAALGGRIDHLVPAVVVDKLYQKLQTKNQSDRGYMT